MIVLPPQKTSKQLVISNGIRFPKKRKGTRTPSQCRVDRLIYLH